MSVCALPSLMACPEASFSLVQRLAAWRKAELVRYEICFELSVSTGIPSSILGGGPVQRLALWTGRRTSERTEGEGMRRTPSLQQGIQGCLPQSHIEITEDGHVMLIPVWLAKCIGIRIRIRTGMFA